MYICCGFSRPRNLSPNTNPFFFFEILICLFAEKKVKKENKSKFWTLNSLIILDKKKRIYLTEVAQLLGLLRRAFLIFRNSKNNVITKDSRFFFLSFFPQFSRQPNRVLRLSLFFLLFLFRFDIYCKLLIVESTMLMLYGFILLNLGEKSLRRIRILRSNTLAHFPLWTFVQIKDMADEVIHLIHRNGTFLCCILFWYMSIKQIVW